MSIKNVAIIGAGGNLGPSILKQLVDSKKFHVTVISRESSTATFPGDVAVRKANFESQASLEVALKGQDGVISTVGTTGLAGQKTLVDAAVAAGVKRFLPSEFGSDTRDPKTYEVIGSLFKSKIAVVDYLKTKENTPMSWSAIVTGPFLDWGLGANFLPFDLKAHTADIYEDGNAPWTTTVLSDIGRAVVGVFSHTEATKNRYVFVGSVTTTENEIVAAFEKATGVKWSTTSSSALESIKEGKAKMAAGDMFNGFKLSLLGTLLGGEKLGFKHAHAKEATESAALFDFPPRNIDDIVAAFVKGEPVA